jgi:hypothetical protein
MTARFYRDVGQPMCDRPVTKDSRQKRIGKRNDGYSNAAENACALRVHREAKRSVRPLCWVRRF